MLSFLLSLPSLQLALAMLIVVVVYSLRTRNMHLPINPQFSSSRRTRFFRSLKHLLRSAASSLGIAVSLLVNVMKMIRGIFTFMRMLH